MSWIALEELTGLLVAAIFDSSCEGAFNAVAPNPVRNREFSSALGAVLHRPAIAPLPAFVVRSLFGEMGEALLLSGAKVGSIHPLVKGHQWTCSRLSTALQFEILGRLTPG